MVTQYSFQELHVTTAVHLPLDEQMALSCCHVLSVFNLCGLHLQMAVVSELCPLSMGDEPSIDGSVVISLCISEISFSLPMCFHYQEFPWDWLAHL